MCDKLQFVEVSASRLLENASDKLKPEATPKKVAVSVRPLFTWLSGVFARLIFHLLSEEPKLAKIAVKPRNIGEINFAHFLTVDLG